MRGLSSGHFKLGQEGKYRTYHNQYSTNSYALNKHQHREDHDKRRHLAHKFCLSPTGEFKWNGSVHGSKVLTISTLRLTIVQLESSVPAPFLHQNWASHRSNWIKAVQMCSKPREFALALAILECAIKPVVMLPIWKDSLGHTRLRRMTSMEREEKDKVKKKERKQEEEETMQQATWVKYTFPIKHQVWKQKGEEYRVTGYGGWSWISKTHVHRFLPRLPGNTNVNYRKMLAEKAESAMEEESSDKKIKAEPARDRTVEEDERKDQSGATEPAEEDSAERGSENAGSMKDEPMEVDEAVEVDAACGAGEGPFPDADLINVSLGFQRRTWYKKVVKSSRLDVLLERRERQFAYEEKQRLERLKLGSGSQQHRGLQDGNKARSIGRGAARKLDLDGASQDMAMSSSPTPKEDPAETAENETKEETPASTDSRQDHHPSSCPADKSAEGDQSEEASDKSVPPNDKGNPEPSAESMDQGSVSKTPEDRSTDGDQEDVASHTCADHSQEGETAAIVITPQVNGKFLKKSHGQETEVKNIPTSPHSSTDTALKAFMNGNVSMEEEDENGISAGKDSEDCGPEKSATSPLTSAEESSLSNDSVQQNGLPPESMNGERNSQTVVTEVTTTTTTVSTSRTVVEVSSKSPTPEVSSEKNLFVQHHHDHRDQCHFTERPRRPVCQRVQQDHGNRQQLQHHASWHHLIAHDHQQRVHYQGLRAALQVLQTQEVPVRDGAPVLPEIRHQEQQEEHLCAAPGRPEEAVAERGDPGGAVLQLQCQAGARYLAVPVTAPHLRNNLEIPPADREVPGQRQPHAAAPVGKPAVGRHDRQAPSRRGGSRAQSLRKRKSSPRRSSRGATSAPTASAPSTASGRSFVPSVSRRLLKRPQHRRGRGSDPARSAPKGPRPLNGPVQSSWSPG
ncbi:unnamed protein product [Ranitomeya imitator]|uniref:Uncharacterized protein n=1 Tax=Ranitomeya imitator TaxID=111125 RepID=A0ABN9M177_9NEOB|nr:unnamed protein product [Ranitomeya imitator]